MYEDRSAYTISLNKDMNHPQTKTYRKCLNRKIKINEDTRTDIQEQEVK